jgi:hypothetical protein
MIKDKDIRDINDEIGVLNWYIKNNKKEKIAYIGINMFGWVTEDTIEKCITGIKETSRKWSDVKAKDLPYRIFMVLNSTTNYNIGMGVEIMGKSDRGYQSILIEDTYPE